MGASESRAALQQERVIRGRAARLKHELGFVTYPQIDGPWFREDAMRSLLPLPDQAIRLSPIMLCAWVLWSSASCEAMNRNATPTSTVEHPEKSSVPRFIPHELLVKFKNGISRERIEFILTHNRIDILSEIQFGRLYHVKVMDDRSVESAITQLTSYQEIEYAEPNHRYEIQK